MEVRSTYAQTNSRAMPDGWTAKTLGEIGTFKNGINKSKEEFGHGSPFVNLLDVFGISSISDEAHLGLVKSSKEERNVYCLREGDVLFVRSSVKAEGVGLTTVVRRDLENTVFSGFLIRFRDNDQLIPAYKEYCFSEDGFRRTLIASSTVSANTNINQGALKALWLVYPVDKKEQRAIGKALSDVDALIESLQQLLVKKRHLKQGAMQELLTSKKRLPGFSGKWDVKRLDELGRWMGGMTPSMRNPDYWQPGEVPWISSGDVKAVRLSCTAFAISQYAVKQGATVVPAKSIIVVTRSGILRNYLPVAMNMIPMAINQDIKSLLPNECALPEYLLHSVTSNGDRIRAQCLKSGTTVESIEFSWLKSFTVPIPSIPEQTAIATVLSDMDAEIAAVEAKLGKARQLKQGMMQELLTGRTRLV